MVPFANNFDRWSVLKRPTLRCSAILLLLTSLTARLPGQTDSAAPPPGKLIDLGGYKLHLNCTGNGTPTVVLAAGAGDFSTDWALVQSKVAAYTRVCSYDRSGAAWSDLVPNREPSIRRSSISNVCSGPPARRARMSWSVSRWEGW